MSYPNKLLLVLITIIVGLSPVYASQEESQIDYHLEYIESFLKIMDEKHLKEGGLGRVYRLIVLPSLGRSYLFRLNVKSDKSAKLYYRGFTGFTENKTESKKVKKTFRLRGKATRNILRVIENINFKEYPAILPLSNVVDYTAPSTGEIMLLEEICMDGTTLKFEVLVNGHYKSIQHGCLHEILDEILDAFNEYKPQEN